MRKFKTKNINCNSCANTIITNFKDEFEDIKVDLDTKTVALSIDEKDLKKFKEGMQDLGFEIVSEVK